jgi:hypothetical protein
VRTYRASIWINFQHKVGLCFSAIESFQRFGGRTSSSLSLKPSLTLKPTQKVVLTIDPDLACVEESLDPPASNRSQLSSTQLSPRIQF